MVSCCFVAGECHKPVLGIGIVTLHSCMDSFWTFKTGTGSRSLRLHAAKPPKLEIRHDEEKKCKFDIPLKSQIAATEEDRAPFCKLASFPSRITPMQITAANISDKQKLGHTKDCSAQAKKHNITTHAYLVVVLSLLW